jgi:hypothetical protein
MPGCDKINNLENCKNFLHTDKFTLPYYFLTHYQYLEETRPIRHKALVILILCNNCDKHKIDPKNCEFILDTRNCIFGIAFKITETKMKTHYMIKNNFQESIHRYIMYGWQPFLFYNKEKFCQTYEINIKLDSNYITPFNLKRPTYFQQSAPPASNITKYLSVFCPGLKKKIQINFKNSYKQIRNVKYGWTMFGICPKLHCNDLSQWSLYTTQKPNEIVPVSCNKPNFNMYILNINRIPMSLLNLSFSSLYQNKLNYALNLTNYIVPKTLSQRAPPCYLFHINPYNLSIENPDECYCCGYSVSSHISDW